MEVKNMTKGRPTVVEKEFGIHNDFAEIKEVDSRYLAKNNENMLRVYCTMYPEVFNVQIRTHKPTTENRKGKPRNMVATINLNAEDIKQLYKYVKTYKDKY